MDRARFIEHKGKQIYQLDCSNALPSDIQDIVVECARVVQSQAKKSVVTLTIAGGGRFDLATIGQLKELTRDNEPYVRRSAIVGVTGLQEVVLMTVAKFSRREFHLFDDLEKAKDFLAAD